MSEDELAVMRLLEELNQLFEDIRDGKRAHEEARVEAIQKLELVEGGILRVQQQERNQRP